VAWGETAAFILLYFSNALYSWLFSIEQWYISITIPTKINNRQTGEKVDAKISKTCYNIMKWIGIVLITAVVGFGIPYRFAESLQYADHINDDKT